MNRLLTLVFASGLLFLSTEAQAVTEEAITATDRAIQSSLSSGEDEDAPQDKDVAHGKKKHDAAKEDKSKDVKKKGKDDAKAGAAKEKEEKDKAKAGSAKDVKKKSRKSSHHARKEAKADKKAEDKAAAEPKPAEKKTDATHRKPEEIIYQRQPEKHSQPVAPPISTVPPALAVPESVPESVEGK